MSDHDYDGQPPYPDWDDDPYPDPDGAPDPDSPGTAGTGTWTLDAMTGDEPGPAAIQPPEDCEPGADRTSLLTPAADAVPWPAQPAHDDAAGGTRRWRRLPDTGTRRPAGLRRLSITTLVLISVAAIALGVTGGDHTLTIIPANDPAAAASSSPALTSPPPATSPVATASPTAPVAATAAASSQPPATAAPQDPPVITLAAAQQVLARYWAVNNAANQARSTALLAGFETGSSYALDAGQYQASLGQDPADSHYVPFDGTGAVYSIPRQPAGTWPRWWAVRVSYPSHGIPPTPASGYIIFTQDSAGAPWKDTLEPYVQPGVYEPTPRISTDADGYATQAELPSGTTATQAATGPVYTLEAFNGTLAFYDITTDTYTQQFAVFIPATGSPYTVATASGVTPQS